MPLVVTKGSRKLSRTKDELARKWMRHSKLLIVNIFNDEMAMGESIFKAIYLEDEVKNGEGNKMTPADMIPLIGT